ncbi:hypothetical protein BDR22DRAFT_972895 [Usnea florida]
MLRSLDPDQLLALLDKNERAGRFFIQVAKYRFRDRNLSEHALNLLMAFANELSRPYLNIHNRLCKNYEQGVDEWDIELVDRPFTHLSIKPDPERSGYIKIYEDEKHIQTFEILACLEQGQAFLNWMWQYGDRRLKRQAAVVARRNVLRKHTKSQLPFNTSTVPSSLKDFTHKHSPDSLLRRPLHQKPFKAQAFKSKGERVPSKLGALELELITDEGGCVEP